MFDKDGIVACSGTEPPAGAGQALQLIKRPECRQRILRTGEYVYILSGWNRADYCLQLVQCFSINSFCIII